MVRGVSNMISKPKPYITVVTLPKDKIKANIMMGAEPVEQMERAYLRIGKPDFMLNGGFFDMKDGKTSSNLIDDGVVKGKTCSNFGLIVDGDNIRFGDITEAKVDFIGGTPALIKNNKIDIDQSYGDAFNNCRHPRSAVGDNADNIFLVTVDGRRSEKGYPGMTLPELAEFMLSLGCTNAINLDGGGSTRLLHKGDAINSPTENRKVDNFICVWMKEEKSMHRVYISASTQDKNIGVGDYGTEQDRMHQLADRVQYWLKTQGKFEVFRNQKGWTLEQTVKDCNNLACELFIDNHTNAPNAEGTEVYFHTGSKNGERMANILYAKIAPISPGKDRGVMVDTKLYQSGLYVLRNTKPPAVLVEHIFHTNVKEVQHMLSNMDQYAKAEAQAVCEYFGEKWTEPTPVPTNDDWKIAGIEALAKAGIITDRDFWVASKDTKIDVWAATIMMAKLLEKIEK